MQPLFEAFAAYLYNSFFIIKIHNQVTLHFPICMDCPAFMVCIPYPHGWAFESMERFGIIFMVKYLDWSLWLNIVRKQRFYFVDEKSFYLFIYKLTPGGIHTVQMACAYCNFSYISILSINVLKESVLENYLAFTTHTTKMTMGT